jgi:hypothetical protein
MSHGWLFPVPGNYQEGIMSCSCRKSSPSIASPQASKNTKKGCKKKRAYIQSKSFTYLEYSDRPYVVHVVYAIYT